jgi:hypothetical protein
VVLPTPKPVVKLPPMMAQVLAAAQAITPAAAEVDVQHAAPAVRATMPPNASSKDKASWQDKFNGLFSSRKPPSPPKTHNITVNSATKAPLEGHLGHWSATVSLPRSEDGSVTCDADEITTRVTEEALMEEREFGSLPIVRLPNVAPANAWQPARTPMSKAKSKFQKAVQVLSIPPYPFHAKETAQGTSIEIRLPGGAKAKTMIKPHPPGSSPRLSQSHPHSKNKGNRSGKSRDSSSNYGSQRGSTQHNTGGASRQNHHSGNWANRLSGTAAH